MHQWAGREKFYAHLEKSQLLAPAHRRPAQADRYLWLLRAFRELSTERAIGMGIGPIPFRALEWYCDRYALPAWCIDALLLIDRGWLDMVNSDGG